MSWIIIAGVLGLGPVACDDGTPGTVPTVTTNADGIADGLSAATPGPGTIPKVRLSPAFSNATFRRPVFVTHAGDGTNRLFVVEQYGRIMVAADDPSAEPPSVFLDIRGKVLVNNNEEGLLALAFHPDYATNGHLYVYYSADDPRRGVLSRLAVSSDDPDRADPESEHVILEVEQPWGNHNGATVLFGPDGYLYISLGDGGWANDPLGSGQDLGTLLGTILRLDVDRPGPDRPYSIPADNPFVDRDGARGEIWAYGLRNVWRMSFDRVTGDLWAGDVGQNKWEEIDLVVKGGNYGWNAREGSHAFKRDAGEPADPLLEPVIDYPRSKGISVTGGYVYRGERHPSLQGVYLYADYVSGKMWGLRATDGVVTEHGEILRTSKKRHISSFGEDEAGEVYVTTFDKLDGRGSPGRVWRIVAE